ncbi:MAG: hypothetical protein QOH75_2656, partial [Actinomycetota bacterium]|nr:hypothetical protein [Actinomycetota bacterium]
LPPGRYTFALTPDGPGNLDLQFEADQ